MILPERVLGSAGVKWIRSGVAIGLISARTCWRSSASSAALGSLAGDQRDVAIDALALDVVRIADHRRLGDERVADQGALDLGGAEPVAGDVEHVVDPAGDPVITVLVAAAAVAGEIFAAIGAEIGLHEAVVVAIDGAHLARPGAGDAEIARGGALEHRCRRRRPAAGRCRRRAGRPSPASCRGRRAGW